MSLAFDPAWSLQDVQTHLGDIPFTRIRAFPSPGTATEEDALRLIESRSGTPCELIDGTLVEKPVGFFQALVAAELLFRVRLFLETHDLGKVVGEQAPFRILKKNIRLPDVSFISWRQVPGRVFPNVRILPFAPDLAVEILSDSNTAREIERKREDFFASGTRLMWVVEPELRTVEVFTSPADRELLREGDTLTGGDVLPGFALQIREWFESAGNVEPRE